MRVDGQQPHILFVNHAPEVLALLRDVFEDEGFRVTTRSRLGTDLDAIVALAPDVITLDYMWPSLKQDWESLELLKQDPRTSWLPVILCTGAMREVQAREEHLRTMGVTVVFMPFEIEQITRAVHDALGQEVAAARVLSASD